MCVLVDVHVCLSVFHSIHYYISGIFLCTFSEMNYSEARNITCYSMRISSEESSIHSLKVTHLRRATFLKLEIEYS